MLLLQRQAMSRRVMKNPAHPLSGVRLEIAELFLFVLPFGSLERIDLRRFLSGHCGHMSRHITVADRPFSSRFGTGRAVPGRLHFDLAVATVTLLHDLVAYPAIVGTAL